MCTKTVCVVVLIAMYVSVTGMVSPLPYATAGYDDDITGLSLRLQMDESGRVEIKVPFDHWAIWYISPPYGTGNSCHLISFNSWYGIQAGGVYTATFRGYCTIKGRL